ncbi:MAG: zinc ribbon domain-containing protein [Acidobacteriia bacterium]|nr:zinc ribbon domain-containing protein [Terriglobia bacterium]
MASFCSNCGFPLGTGVVFCSKCGTRQASAPAPQPAVSGGAAKSGSGLKILFVVLGVIFLLGVTAVAGLLYVGHRVKQAVVQEAHTYGVDLPTSSAAPSSSASARRNPCDYVSKDEASRLLGEPIARTAPQDQGCAYFAPPGRSAQLAQQRGSDLSKQIQSGKEMKPGDIVGALNRITSGVSTEGGDAPLLLVALDFDGAEQWAALTAGKALFGSIPRASISTEVPNLGDRALRMTPLGLNVLKGSTLIRIVPGPVPGADEISIAIAKVILSRL